MSVLSSEEQLFANILVISKKYPPFFDGICNIVATLAAMEEKDRKIESLENTIIEQAVFMREIIKSKENE